MVGGDGVEREVEHHAAGVAGAGDAVGQLLQRGGAGGLGGDAGDRRGRAEREGRGGRRAGMFRARNIEGVAGPRVRRRRAIRRSPSRGWRGGGGLELVAAPGGEEELLEGGVGRVEGLAAAGVGLAVEVAVVGLVDAAGLLAGLADERGEVLAEGREGAAEIGLHQRRRARPAGRRRSG